MIVLLVIGWLFGIIDSIVIMAVSGIYPVPRVLQREPLAFDRQHCP